MSNPPNSELNAIRVDKWLWATRFYKTRSQATDACQGEKIKRNGKALKPSAAVKPGNRLLVSKTGLIRDIEIVSIIKKRAGAEVAASCYIDHTPQDRLDAYIEARRAANAHRHTGTGRPTKRDRRDIDSLLQSLNDMGYGDED